MAEAAYEGARVVVSRPEWREQLGLALPAQVADRGERALKLRALRVRHARLDGFDHDGDGFAAADAQRREPASRAVIA